ncbi:MAG: glycine cleavage system protein H [Actinomycetota bacterium]
MSERRKVRGYLLDLDRRYDPGGHLWVEVLGEGLVRVGMDPLGVKIAGEMVQITLKEVATRLARGRAFATLEAERFVGPLTMPISGMILVRNRAAVADPRIIAQDPFGEGWLAEIEPSNPAELDLLISGPGAVTAWFEKKVREYRLKGALAD